MNNVKIIQIVSVDKFHILGLGDDGVVYTSGLDGWEVYMDLIFKKDSKDDV